MGGTRRRGQNEGNIYQRADGRWEARVHLGYQGGRRLRKSYYGPTIAAYRNIADDPARVVELDQVLADLGDRYLSDGHMPWEYLLVVATRA